MHNNGSNRLILPERGPILSSAAPPPSGVRITVNAHGVGIVPFVGDQSLSMQLTIEQATNLGVSLISASALQQQALAAVQAATKANTADPLSHEKTPPRIITED